MVNEKINLKQIEQTQYAESMIDGIIEILMGLLLLFCPLFFFKPYFVVFVPLFILFGKQIIDSIRDRTTYPRIGRVELRTEIETDSYSVKKSVLELLFLLVGALTVTFLAMFIIEGTILEISLWYKWIPLMFGLIMFGPSQYLVENTGRRVYYLFGVFNTIFGFSLSLITFPDIFLGMSLYFMTLGIIVLLYGVIKYIKFVRTYPVIDTGED